MAGPPREVRITKSEPEIDRPTDRAAKRNKLSESAAVQAVSGTGGSGTLRSNGTEQNWFVPHVSVTANGSSLAVGALSVAIEIKDEGGEVVTGQVIDPAVSGYVSFGGHIVKPGWDIDYSITQSDANSYDVSMRALTREADPDSGSATDTTAIDIIEDFERSSPLGAYTGDTTLFSAITSNVFSGSKAIETTDTSNPDIWSTGSAAVDYPSAGDTFSYRVYGSEGSSSTAPQWSHFRFGVQDTSNYYQIRKNHEGTSFLLSEVIGGTTTTESTDSFSNDGGVWSKPVVKWGSGGKITVDWYDQDGNILGGASIQSTEYDSGGIGWGVQQNSANTVRFDYSKQE